MKKSKENPTCYMCDEPSVGKDHVPPLCLFPESSEYRKSLVKVWSCDKHNSGKSTDDQLLRWVLATTNCHNDLAMQVLNEGANPLLEKKPHLRETFQPDMHIGVRADGSEGGMMWAVDSKRFISSISAIVRGLFYHHMWYSAKLLGEMTVSWKALKDKENALASLHLPDAEYKAFTSPSPNQPALLRGANPRVFQYEFDQDSNPTHDICLLRFYEGETIYVRWEKPLVRDWSTKLESIAEYFKAFPTMQLPPLSEMPLTEKATLIGQCDQREARLLVIGKEARHKRDKAAAMMITLLLKENHLNRERLLSSSTTT